jgi:hypothetical protein
MFVRSGHLKSIHSILCVPNMRLCQLNMILATLQAIQSYLQASWPVLHSSCMHTSMRMTCRPNGGPALQAPVDADLAQQQAVAPAKMLVPQLKEQLKTFNMPVSGKKADLVHRLDTALAAAAATGHASDAMSPDTTVTSGTTAGDAVPDAMARDGHGASASAVLDGQSEDDHGGVSYDVRSDGAGEGEAKGRRGKAKQKAVGGVQPGTQGLGDVMTAEVSCMSCSAANPGAFPKLMTLCR